MSPGAPTLLAQLRRRGVRFQLVDDRLRVSAPRGVIEDHVRTKLTDNKPELLDRLRSEAGLLQLSLGEFARQHQVIELSVPWLAESLWFVPRVEHADGLVRDGVPRGRIWTARELTFLEELCDSGDVQIATVGRLKAVLDADFIEVQERAEDRSDRPQRCRACGSSSFWRSTPGVTVCATCHPPATANLVAEWIDNETSDA